MDREIRKPIDAGQQIDVPRDKRTLRDDRYAQPRMLGEDFQDAARDSESSLRWLIWICRGADNDCLALEELEMPVASESESTTQNLWSVSFDEDVALEREPGRKIVVSSAELLCHSLVGGGALHHIAMGVASVAVSAPEGTSDVGIDRPESHPGGLWPVEDALRRRRVVADVLLLTDHG